MIPKAWATKEKVDKLDFLKMKNQRTGFHQKTRSTESKGPREQEKILANYVSEKGLISSIHKELLQLNNKYRRFN